MLFLNFTLCVCVCTGAAVVLFHPDVAVVLGHAGLRVQERQADAPLGTKAGIVAAALLNGLLIELIAQPATGVTSGQCLRFFFGGGGGKSHDSTGSERRVSRSARTCC